MRVSRNRSRTCGWVLDVVRPRIVIVVIRRCPEERLFIFQRVSGRIRRKCDRRRVCAGLDYRVDNPELHHVHDDWEDTHSTATRQYLVLWNEKNALQDNLGNVTRSQEGK